MRNMLWKSRWAAVGAAVAVTVGAGGIGIVDATKSSGERAVYTAIEPCRLVDTRPNYGIGGRTAPLGPDETVSFETVGDNGECTNIPGDVVAVELNVTGLLNTSGTHFTVWDGDGSAPNASHVNLAPGASPTPNSVTTELDNGRFAVRNNSGNAHLIVDVVGIYQDHDHDDRYYTKTEIDNRTWGSGTLTDEPGVAYSFMGSPHQVDDVDEVAVTTQLRPPADGHVHVTVSGIWHNADVVGADRAYCQIQHGAPNAASFDEPGAFVLADYDADQTDWQGFSHSATFPVAAADNPANGGQLFSLVCRETDGIVQLDDTQITAMYFPTSYQPAVG